MARGTTRKPPRTGPRSSPAGDDGRVDTTLPGTTGRYLVLFERSAMKDSADTLGRVAGLHVANARDFAETAPVTSDLDENDALLLPDLGVAIVDRPPEELSALTASASTGVLAIEPERIVYAISDLEVGARPVQAPPAAMLDYLYGYRDAINHLVDRLSGSGGDLTPSIEATFADDAEYTWGLLATRVATSSAKGAGIKVAVLDTGFDMHHPDFATRGVVGASFIGGQSVQDGHGHGTHCIGTACGPGRPGILPRYGAACEAQIFAGKVLSDQGSGGDAGILAGIQWAVANKCEIVSLSLGSRTLPGQQFSQVFERVARRALTLGTAVIAAAGNDSSRPSLLVPVSHPANCPSIIAVGAVDRHFRVAGFSNAGLTATGGQVDIVGPGVAVRSSWPSPLRYNTISGTSMATPHVAGIAAMWAGVSKDFRGRALLNVLAQYARRLPLPARDVGAGLVQAPP